MNNYLKINIVRNELENCISDAQKTFELNEYDLVFILESILSNARQKAITREAYNQINNSNRESHEEES